MGGFAQNGPMLFSSRALQGVFGALLAPAALSLISVTFTDSKERAKAFGVYGALSGLGAAVGLISGGLLTQYFSWRWCMFVNTPMAMIAFFLALGNVKESKVEGHPHYDVPGALTATAGMISIVYGVSQASTNSWGSSTAWPFIVLGALLLATFLNIESRKEQALMPIRLIKDRVRGGAYLGQVLVSLALYGMFLFMTFYFQQIHGYSAVRSGLLFLPFSLGVIFSAIVASKLLPKFGPRPLATVGTVMGAGGLFYLSQVTATSSYGLHVLPGMLIISLGMGLVFVPTSSTALFNVRPQDTGSASAVLNTSQQIGGSFGTAIQNTIAVSSAAAFLKVPHMGSKLLVMAEARVHGYDMAFRFGSLMFVLAALVFFFMVNIDRHHLGQHDAPAGVSH